MRKMRGYDCFFNSQSGICQLYIHNGRKIKHEGEWTCEMKNAANQWINSTYSVPLEFKNDPAELISNSISNFLTGFMKSLEEIGNLIENFD